MELTPSGFIELNLMEACDPEGGQEELWVTLESMGYSRTLQLAKVWLNLVLLLIFVGDDNVLRVW